MSPRARRALAAATLAAAAVALFAPAVLAALPHLALAPEPDRARAASGPDVAHENWAAQESARVVAGALLPGRETRAGVDRAAEEVIIVSPARWVNDSATVTFLVSNRSAAPVDACYTLDGTDPSPSGACVPAGDSIEVHESATVRARSVDQAGNIGKIAERFVGIDRVPPETSAPPPDVSAWSKGPVTLDVRGLATDGASGVAWVEFRRAGERSWAAAGRFAVTREGTTTVEIRAVDRAGNADPTPATVTVRVDADVPRATATKWPSAAWTREDVHVTMAHVGTAVSPERLCYRLGNGTRSCVAGTTTLRLSEPGHVVLTPVDEAGNVGDRVVVQVGIDRVAPEFVVRRSPERAWSNGPVTLDAALVGDGLSPETLCVEVVGVSAESCSAGPARVVVGAAAEARLRAFDGVGHEATAVERVQIDATPPVLTVSRSPDVGWSPDPVTVTLGLDGDDGLSPQSVCYRMSEAQEEVCASGPLSVTLSEATTLHARAVDEAGNEHAIDVPVRVDGVAPVIRVTREPDVEWAAGEVSVAIDLVEDGLSPETLCYALDDEAERCGDTPVTLALNATATVRARAYDEAGNTAALEETVRIDPTPPVLQVARSPDVEWAAGPVAVNLSLAGDGHSPETLCHAIEDAAESCGPAPVALTLSASATVTARAFDAAGHEDETVVDVRIDDVAPVIRLTREPDVEWARDDVTLTLALDEDGLSDETLCYTLGEAPEVCGAASATLEVTESATVAARAFDEAGNEARASTTVRIDSVVPVIDVALDPDADWAAGPVTVTLTLAGDGLSPETLCYSVGDAAEACGDALITFTVNSTADVRARAFDEAGNEATTVVPVRVDDVAPVIDVARSPDVAWAADDVRLDVTLAGDGRSAETLCHAIDGGAESCGRAPLTLSLTESATVTLRALDEAGNEAARAVEVWVDRVAPVIRVARSPDVEWSAGIVTLDISLAGDALAPETLCYAVGEAAEVCGASPLAVVVAESADVRVRAFDEAGHAASLASPVRVDRVAPVLRVARSPDAVWSPVPVSVTLALDGDDGLSPQSVCYRVAGDDEACGAGPMTIIVNDSSTLHARAVDEAGNEDARAVNVRVDPDAPNVALENLTFVDARGTRLDFPAHGVVRPGNLTVVALAEDAQSGLAEFTLSWDGALVASAVAGRLPATLALAPGEHALVARAVDAAGHAAEATVRVLVDDAPPTLAPDLPATLRARAGDVVTFPDVGATDAGGVARVEWDFGDGARAVALGAPAHRYASRGEYEVTVRAFDLAGNAPAVHAFRVIVVSVEPWSPAPSAPAARPAPVAAPTPRPEPAPALEPEPEPAAGEPEAPPTPTPPPPMPAPAPRAPAPERPAPVPVEPAPPPPREEPAEAAAEAPEPGRRRVAAPGPVAALVAVALVAARTRRGRA